MRIKSLIFQIIILLLFNNLFSGDYISIINEFPFSTSEKSILIMHLSNIQEKKLDIEPFILILKEHRLKNSDYYEVLKSIIRKQEIFYYMTNMILPYSDQEIRNLISYLLEIYSPFRISSICSNLTYKKINKNDFLSIINLLLIMNNLKINKNDSLNFINILIDNNIYKKDEINAITKLLLRHKEINISCDEIINEFIKMLNRSFSINRIIKEIEKKYKY